MEIMATTTNNHNQKELRLYAPNDQQQQSATTATALATSSTGARSPFQREVREWQRIDPDTGALLTGRLEADRWINGPLNKYGKISDSQNISQPNGTQQTQRKQLEVLQTCTAGGGAMQVIRSQTVQTTSSRWSTSSASASPLLLSASTSPIPQLQQQQMAPPPSQQQQTPNKKHYNNNFKQKLHNSSNTTTSANNNTTTKTTSSPFIASPLLTNGFHHHHNHHQQKQQKQFPHSLVNGNSNSSSSTIRNRNWPDITENMSTLDICDNEHDNEHDHDNDYIVQQSTDDDDQHNNDNDDDFDNDSLIDDINDVEVELEDDDHDDDHHQYLVNKRNNLKNKSADSFTKRHSFTMLAKHKSQSNNDQTAFTATSNKNHYDLHNDHHQLHNLSRDSSSGSCSNSNQLFLLDTAPSLKLSNLMKSSSSISNSSNNSTTASQATTASTNPSSSMNTHKSMASKISLHAIVGNNNTTATATTSSSTPSPTSTTTARPSWQQPTIYRQNSQSNNTTTAATTIQQQHGSHTNATHSHLMTTRVGDNNNNTSNSSSDESRSFSLNSLTGTGGTAADLRHLHQYHHPSQTTSQQQQHQQQLHLKQNDRLTPTHSQQLYSNNTSNRVDLESFRHYNTNHDDLNIVAHASNAADDDDGLRLSSRHLRRQQTPPQSSLNALQRSRSISTDDLSTEWDTQGGDTEEPSEWRRVSKLRRSFQSSTAKTQQTYQSPTSTRRPLDLPTNSVSVSKIRAELENSRRLNTVMKNNHVDLAALSTILNGSGDKETKSPQTPKRSTILTAESLKEIRGKLKKLSDESLYREDFVINQHLKQPETIQEVEHIVNDQAKLKRNFNRSPQGYRVPTEQKEPINKHTTNSLESRVKYKDTNSSDWHLRRKSYGFEKMSPPEKAMLRMDASTDSGLGRSGELQNWSPTSDANPNNRTVVHFGKPAQSNTTAVQRRYRPQKSYEDSEHSPEEDNGVSKRHSIAVDESQYVRDNSRQTTQIHLNGFYEPGNYSKLIHSTESTTTTDFLNRGQQKRVEFSKTEVHFATESGRVNIVETDSKPPPTNNFRRRKSRSSSVGPLQSLVKSATTVSSTSSVTSSNSNTGTSSIPSGVAMPVTLFGDDSSRKKTLASTTVAYRAPLVDSPEPKDSSINVTITIPNRSDSFLYNESSRSSYASTSGVDTTDCDTDEMTSLRGILKNKPAKPKPYVLGENIDKPDDLWGVQLKPVASKADNMGRALKTDSPPLLTSTPPKSVAERIQELGTSSSSSQSNGFSTKINVSLGGPPSSATNWEETGLVTSATSTSSLLSQRRPSVQELLMQDLKEHQKILDEGLKSTTLIIKTMRSASEFDEAMRRLSIASIEAAVAQPTPLMLRSNSYQESSQSYEFIEPDKQNLYKSTSFSSTSSWSTVSSSRKYSTDSRKTSTDSGASFPRKDSMPRLSFLGNEQIPVSQQLQRLRLIYDAATMSQDEDSADEEVKSYFKGQVDSDSGGGTQESSSYEDDHNLENTNSWSRLKAKKTIWKIDMDNGGDKSLTQPLDKTDLPTSNVMSIKLHSPQVTTEMPAPLKVMPPVAKPRTITSIQETQHPKIHTATPVKQTSFQTSLPTKDSLKIIKEARGARQLREHELSYFGVPISTSEDEKPKSKYTTTNSNFRNSPKRSLPMRKLSEESTMSLKQEKRAQWQLEHDKPDLLKHSPIVNDIMDERHSFRDIKPAERTSLKKKAELDEEEEHLYENIANEITPVFKVKASTPPDQYDRKMDLKRDAMILSEMNKNADQTLRELSDEAALKDRRRRSLQRRNSKPLETIDEKTITERINDTCIAVKVSRGTYASEAKKTSRHNTPSPTSIKPRERTSSQSSVESCPRARSRSLSSEKEYENIKSKPSRSLQMVKHKTQKPLESRSSSLDSQRSANSQYSSGDEQQLQQQRPGGSFRREDRSRTKTKRVTNFTSASSTQRDKHREDKTSRQSSSSQQHHGDPKRISSTTHSTTHRERVECKHDNATGSGTSQHRHHPTSSGLQRSTPASGSGRRYKEDVRDSQRMKRTTTTASGRSTSERHDNREHSSSKHTPRSSRDDERNSSQRSSSHRLERGDKDKDRTSKSTKGHSSRSTSQHHHERSTTNPDKHATTSKDTKTKSTNNDNTTHSKNAQHHHTQHSSKDRRDRSRHRSKRDEESTEHVHGLKSAIIKTTTKLRDKSRTKKEKK